MAAAAVRVSVCHDEGARCRLHGLVFGPAIKCGNCGSRTLTVGLPRGAAACTCDCCGGDLCFSCHGHGWTLAGTTRELVVCQSCVRTCNARAGVFTHPRRGVLVGGMSKDEEVAAATAAAIASAVAAVGVKREFPAAPMMGASAAAAAAAAAASGRPPAKRARRVVVVVKHEASAAAAAAVAEDVVAAAAPGAPPVRAGRRSRGRTAPHVQFMPPLAPADAPFVMMVQNLVFTGDVGTSVRLAHVQRAMAHRGAELNPRRFSAVVTRVLMNASLASEADLERRGEHGMHPLAVTRAQRLCGEEGPMRAPATDDTRLQGLLPVTTRRERVAKVAVLLFRTGKLVCTGARDLAQARYILREHARALRSMGYPAAEIVRMNIRNMVGCAQLSVRIDRDRLASALSEYATFDVEQFPGVTIKGHPLTKPVTLLVFMSGRVVVTGTKSKACADAALSRIHRLLLHFDINTPPGTPMPVIVPEDYAPLDERSPWPEAVASGAAYAAFGVATTASTRDVHVNWRARMRAVHPDKFAHVVEGTPEYSVLNAEVHFIQDIYDILHDTTKRALYNQTGTGMPTPPAAYNPHHAEHLRDIIAGRTSATNGAAASTGVGNGDAAAAATAATAVVPPLPDSDSESDGDAGDASDASDDDDDEEADAVDQCIAETFDVPDDDVLDAHAART